VRRITTRFALLIATAAFLPLAVYGLVSVRSLQAGTERSVIRGNHALAEQIARRIGLYFEHNARVLRTIGAELRGTQLERRRRELVLRNFVIDFQEFREITVFDAAGRPLASSRVGETRLALPESTRLGEGDYHVAAPHLDTDLLPPPPWPSRSAREGQAPGWIVAEISLEELWRTVDESASAPKVTRCSSTAARKSSRTATPTTSGSSPPPPGERRTSSDSPPGSADATAGDEGAGYWSRFPDTARP
jgi:hypothetical protein